MNGQLKVPNTERTQNLLLDFDSKSLAAEIKDLPYVDIPSALMLVHRKLHSFNRFYLSPVKRLQLVGPFHYAFQRFLDYYRNQFSGGLFAREMNPNDLENLMSFIQELGFAYKHIVQDTLQNNKKPAGIATAIYMAMSYQYYYAMFSYNRGRMLSNGFWKDIHQLYFLGCELGQEDLAVSTPEEKNVSLTQLYKRCILMGLSSPHAMTAEDQWRTSDYLIRHGDLIKLLVPDSVAAITESYHVVVDCQAPANVPNYKDFNIPFLEDCRVLDLTPLLETVHRHLRAAQTGDTSHTVHIGNLPRQQAVDFFTNLYNTWSHNTERQHERKPIDEKIGLVWGLENICRMLDPEHRRLASLESRNNSADNRAWSRGKDESVTGIRVSVSGDAAPQAGQVVAMIRQRNSGKILQIGMVKWAAISQDELPECGITLLRGNTHKVDILHPEDAEDRRNGLLVLQKGRPQNPARCLVVAPNKLLKTGTETAIQSPEHMEKQQIEVQNITQRSRLVDVYAVKLVEN